jgi:hypothetical protein
MKLKQHQKILKLIVIFIFFISITLLFYYYTQSNSIEFMSFNLSKFFQLPKFSIPKISMPKFLKNINFPSSKLLRKNKIPLNQTTNTNTYRVVNLRESDPLQKVAKKLSDEIKETKEVDIKNPQKRRKFLQDQLKEDPKFQELKEKGLVEINGKYGMENMIQFQYPYIFKGTFNQYLENKKAFLDLNSNFTKRIEEDYKITDEMINPPKKFKDKYKSIHYQLTSDPEYRILKQFGVKRNRNYGKKGNFLNDKKQIIPAFVIRTPKNWVGKIKMLFNKKLKQEVDLLNSSMNVRFQNEILRKK